MDANNTELTPSAVEDLKGLAKCYAIIGGMTNVGTNAKREMMARLAEGLWHVMYEYITPKKENAPKT